MSNIIDGNSAPADVLAKPKVAAQQVAAETELCRSADILIAAVGRPGMIKADWIKPGATEIDVGSNGKTCLVGDVAYEEATTQAVALEACG